MITRQFSIGDDVTILRATSSDSPVKVGMTGKVRGYYPPVPLTNDSGRRTGEIAISYDVEFPSGSFIVHEGQMELTTDVDIEQFRLD